MNNFHADAWDVILLADPSGAVGDWNARAMAGVNDDSDEGSLRLYSFVQPGIRLGRRGRIRLESMSGQVIYQLGAEHVGVRVLWLPTPDSPRIDKEATALVFKRKAFWHNGKRNDYVAAVARAFTQHDVERLVEYGVPFRGGKPVLRHAPDTKIAVLVAGTEQAREMAKRLPGWKVVDAASGKASGKADSKEAGTPEVQGTIITETAAGKHGLDADVVIRTGGSSGNLCFKHFPPALDEDKRDAVLVDFTDTFDRRAVQDAKRRHREYELLGWESGPEPGTVAKD